jgi:hypothetical protein
MKLSHNANLFLKCFVSGSLGLFADAQSLCPAWQGKHYRAAGLARDSKSCWCTSKYDYRYACRTLGRTAWGLTDQVVQHSRGIYEYPPDKGWPQWGFVIIDVLASLDQQVLSMRTKIRLQVCVQDMGQHSTAGRLATRYRASARLCDHWCVGFTWPSNSVNASGYTLIGIPTGHLGRMAPGLTARAEQHSQANIHLIWASLSEALWPLAHKYLTNPHDVSKFQKSRAF